MSTSDPAPVLSVVVLSWNTQDLTLACLRALESDTPRHAREVIVVDNGSEDGSADALAEVPGIVLARNTENAGYAAGNNQGAELGRGRYVCLLNSDTEVRPGALDAMVDFLEGHTEHGAVAPRLVNPDGSAQCSCMRFPGLGVALCYGSFLTRFPPGSWIDNRYYMRDFDHLTSRDVDQPPGACFMMNRAEYLEIGGLDPNLFLFFNDVDLCRRLWTKGRRIHYLAEAEVMHHVGGSTKGYDQFVVTWFRNRIAYYRKNHGLLARPLLTINLWLRAFEEWVKAGWRHRDRGSVRAERAHIRNMLKEIRAP